MDNIINSIISSPIWGDVGVLFALISIVPLLINTFKPASGFNNDLVHRNPTAGLNVKLTDTKNIAYTNFIRFTNYGREIIENYIRDLTISYSDNGTIEHASIIVDNRSIEPYL